MRIVIKIGTKSLLLEDNTLDRDFVTNITQQIIALKQSGHDVALVSSGAVGAGRAAMQSVPLKISDTTLEKQALASIGQAQMMDAYTHALKPHGFMPAQLLLTKHDFMIEEHYKNISALFEALLTQKSVVPIINENDSVATDELMLTDNDQLAALLATQMGAEKMIILTDVDGVYDMSQDHKTVIPEIAADTPLSEFDTSQTSSGRGGMQSKIENALRLAQIGTTVHIARARAPDILLRLMKSEKVGTTFPASKKVKPVKRWLSNSLHETKSSIQINACLTEQLQNGDIARSILPIGVTGIISPFEAGDLVSIIGHDGIFLGRGIARYGSEELKTYLEQKNKPVFIHYDNLYIEKVKTS